VKGRLTLLLVCCALWLGALAGRLYQLQVLEHGHYTGRAANQQRSELVLTPPRGTIYDARGRELAMSVEAASAFADPTEIADPQAAARQLARIVGGNAKQLAAELSNHERRFVWIERQLEPERAAEIRNLAIEGVYFTNESKREYPQGRLAASVIGFTGVDPKGLAGVELAYEQTVEGEEVRRTVLRDARRGRRLYDSFSLPEAEPGADLYLTIDSSIQHVAERELAAVIERQGARGGSIVMLDPRSGAILAMASYPGFDPSDYRKVDPDRRRNIPVQDIYEPGSTFKLITAAAALEAGAVDPFDRFDCGHGGINFKGKYIRDHKAFDELSFSEIIAYSSNVGAIKLGVRVGEERLHDTIRAFGFGSKSGIDLPGEEPGIVHDVANWNKRAIAYTSFGQGISVTPLQLVNAFAAIANGGTLYRPYVVAGIGRDGKIEAPAGRPQVLGHPISATTARTLERMLEMVVEHERGTGKHAAIPGYRVAGKTGTAEKPGVGGYSDGKYVASFVGFAPARDPAVAALVIIDEPHGPRYHGGDAPADVFKIVVRHALLRLGVPRDQPPAVATLPSNPSSAPSGVVS
jgi:cell division protein FtsI (penicillin-binding protein 3)